MSYQKKLDRINALAKKEKASGLTAAEKEEREQLRSDYLQSMRKSFKKQLSGVKVIDPNGTDVTPEKLKQLKTENKEN